ncbi:hypothetical protein PIB30_114835, partial [Stylosanthes scabra]|nr:hypothetical protein [Stylosanthes scabra]
MCGLAPLPQLHSGVTNLLLFFNAPIPALPEEPKAALQPSLFPPPRQFDEDHLSLLLPMVFEENELKQGRRD